MQWACAIMSSVVFPVIQYFSTLSDKQHDFGGQKWNIKRVFHVSLQLLCETFLILRRNEKDIIKNVYWSETFLILRRNEKDIIKNVY